MASPLQTGKKSVNLASRPAGSRIRRDPPPAAKKVAVQDPEERERRIVIIGVVTFALAIAAVIVGWSSYSNSSPSEYNVTVNLD